MHTVSKHVSSWLPLVGHVCTEGTDTFDIVTVSSKWSLKKIIS